MALSMMTRPNFSAESIIHPVFPAFTGGREKCGRTPATQPPVGGRAADEVGTVHGPTRTLGRHPSAVDVVGRARDVACALRAEPDDDFGDLFGITHALKRGVGKDRLAAQ